MENLKKKFSVKNVFDLLSDKQLKATMGGSGGFDDDIDECIEFNPLIDEWMCKREFCWYKDEETWEMVYGFCAGSHSAGTCRCELFG